MSDEMVEKARAADRNSEWNARWDAYRAHLKKYPNDKDSWRIFWAGCVAEESFARSAVRDAVRECADFVMNWRNEDGDQQFGHYVIAAALRQKFNIEEKP